MLLELNQISKFFKGNNSHALNELTLALKEGEIVCLVGESGCGKTTCLRAIAGFERPDSGSISLNGKILCDDSNYVPPEKRGISMVFQEDALFPHLSVKENINFALDGISKSKRTDRVKEMLKLVDLEEEGDRYPHQLSGGQRQRVALARALAPDPDMVLLDEPYSNLDEMLKAQLLEEINIILRKRKATALIVTHTIADAIQVADRIAILKDGILQQFDTPQKLYDHPVNSYVAKFFGTSNILNGKVKDGYIETAIGPVHIDVEDGIENVKISIRPEHFDFVPDTEGLCSDLRHIRFRDGYKELLLQVQDQPSLWLKVKAKSDMDVSIGDCIHVQPHPEKVRVLND
ncbi:MAG: ABC transporter ATP-binding protein [Lentisphaeria bacterium]|nr:ABC transporter ATP-binding protein [Lentisphaeria bacterium]NQZ70810.1 ABC transporter ATP-binding protein [Lentisphaeria bacterium]